MVDLEHMGGCAKGPHAVENPSKHSSWIHRMQFYIQGFNKPSS